MSTLISFAGSRPMSACGYKIVLASKTGEDKVLCESTFNLLKFLETHPKYQKATVIETKKDRGVTVFRIKV